MSGIGAYSDFGGPPITQIVTSQKNEGLYVTGCHRRMLIAIGEPCYLAIIIGSVVGLIFLLVIGMGEFSAGVSLYFRLFLTCFIRISQNILNVTTYIRSF